MYILMWIIAILMIIVIVLVSVGVGQKVELVGGYLSPRVGPVDLLQQSKQWIMFGHRFQNPLVPPDAINQRPLSDYTDVDLSARPRVGRFLDSSIQDTETQVGGDQSSDGGMTQLKSKDSQDWYLSGSPGDPIEDSLQPYSRYVNHPPPISIPNNPNPFFSKGDVWNRYQGQFSI